MTTSRSRSALTVLGSLIVLALAAPVAGCARTAGTGQPDAAAPGAGQVGDAPGGGQAAPGGGDPGPAEPSPDTPTEEEPADPTPDPGVTPIGPLVLIPGILIPWPSPADCLSHNPSNVTIKHTAGSDLWQIVDGSHAMLAYKRQVDAEAGLALAKAYKKHCFIGRGNTRPDRARYIMDYWLEPVVNSPAIVNPDCIPHDASKLYVEDLGGLGWRVRTNAELIALFDTKKDAEDAILVMKHYNRHCYIGRGYTGSDRLEYITNWFATV